MRTNIDIDDALLMEAERLTGIGTKRELVDRALRLFVEVLRRKPLAELRGRIRFADSYDHKALRERTKRPPAGRP